MQEVENPLHSAPSPNNLWIRKLLRGLHRRQHMHTSKYKQSTASTTTAAKHMPEYQLDNSHGNTEWQPPKEAEIVEFGQVLESI
jgi:hypothetical protein